MENLTARVPLKQPIVFELEGFHVPEGQGPLLFFLALANYIVVLVGNGVVGCIIVVVKNLHKPMYWMVCHLAACDLLGGTTVLVRLMIHFLTGRKSIAYNTAIFQAFFVHTYVAAVQTILAAMAYDRYVAVCEPLRYHTIMSSSRLIFSLILAWFIAFLLIGVLFALNVGTPLCGTLIKHVYCSNRSILRLACEPTPINNFYGMAMTWCLSSGTFLVIAYSYIKILLACFKQGRSESGTRSKAFQTCAPHLFIYVLFEIAIHVVIVIQRFPNVSQNIKKFITILMFSVPTAVNPIIYGLVTKELRASIIKQFTKIITKLRQQDIKAIN